MKNEILKSTNLGLALSFASLSAKAKSVLSNKSFTMPRLGVAGGAVLLALALPVQAELIDNGDGTIDDTVLNITWLKLANNGVQFPQSNWNDAATWAANLVFAGHDDWRLPSMDLDGDGVIVNCALLTNEEACRDNEMGYMYYQNGIKFSNQGPFVIGFAAYWAAESSGTGASVFNMVYGDQATAIPKTFTNGTWAVRTRTPTTTAAEDIAELSATVMAMNIKAGISNALDAKLSATLNALDDTNQNNDSAAINSLYAFCSSVEAQRGKKLTDIQADTLRELVNNILIKLDELAQPCS